jgi:hypothetical protein
MFKLFAFLAFKITTMLCSSLAIPLKRRKVERDWKVEIMFVPQERGETERTVNSKQRESFP